MAENNNNLIEVPIVFNTQNASVELGKMSVLLKQFEINCNQNLETVLHLSEKSSKSFTKISASIVAISDACNTFKNAVLSIANNYMTFTDVVSKMSQRTGIAAESLAGLKFAAEQSGANFEILTEGLRTFQKNLADAQHGDNKLGLDTSGGTDEALMAFADKIKNINSETQQVKLATEAFGNAGYKLLPMLQEGRDGITKLKDEAKSLGLTLDETAIQEGVKLTDATNRMKQSFASVSNQIVAGLAPSLTSLFDNVAKWSAFVTRTIRDCPVLVSNIGRLTSATIAFAAILKTVPAIFSAITAHPAIAILTGIALAFAAINAALSSTDKDFNAVTNSMQKQREAGDELIANDKQRIERLKELQQISDEGTLNNNEVEEASTLVKELTNRYGDLGIEIDETTGKIFGMTDATKKLQEQMASQRRSALEKEKIELDSNIESIQTQIDNITNRKYTLFGLLIGAAKADREKLKELFKELEKYQDLKRIVNNDMRSVDAGVNSIESPEPSKKTPTQIKAEATAAATLASLNASVANYGKSKTELELANIDKETNKYKEAYKAKYGSLPSMSREEYEQNKDKLPEDLTQEERASVAYFRFMDVQSQKRKEVEKKAAEQAEKERHDAATKAKDEAQKRAEIEQLGVDNRPASVIEAQKRVDALQETISAKRIGTKTDDNRSIKALQTELDKAKLELAKTVAKTSGQARIEAREKYESELADFDDMKKFSSMHSVDEMKAQWERVEKAKSEFDKQNDEYNSAVGTIQAAQEERANNQISQAKQTIETATSQGTFSAWEVGSIGNNTARQQLDTMKKMLDELIKINKNTEEGAVVA